MKPQQPCGFEDFIEERNAAIRKLLRSARDVLGLAKYLFSAKELVLFGLR